MNQKNFSKYTSLYMSVGICFGLSFGLIFGSLLFPNHPALGMSITIPIGLSLGLVLGAAKDKRLSENAMEVIRIEEINASQDVFVYVKDRDGLEKKYQVSLEVMKAGKFAPGDCVAEDTDGTLVSLEDKI